MKSLQGWLLDPFGMLSPTISPYTLKRKKKKKGNAST